MNGPQNWNKKADYEKIFCVRKFTYYFCNLGGYRPHLGHGGFVWERDVLLSPKTSVKSILAPCVGAAQAAFFSLNEESYSSG